MNSLFFIAKNNIKKHKGEVAILFALIFIAGALLFMSLSLILSGKNMINECDRKYHVADLLVMAKNTDEDTVRGIIDPIEGAEMIEYVPVIDTGADYLYRDMDAEDAISYEFYFYDSTKPTYLMSYPEEFIDLNDDEITLPYYMSYTIHAGDTFIIKIAGKDYEFKVKGFTENLFFATSMNISGFNVLVSHDVFEEISESVDPSCNKITAYCKVKEGVALEEYDKAVQDAFPDEISFTTTDRAVMNVATTSISNIACSIILVFTVMLVVMSIIIMHFSIKNFIELNIQNIGLLQATGYTARELRLACITEQMIIGILATVAAVIVGLFCSRPLTTLSGMLIGLSGFSGICLPALISTLIGIPAMVFLGSLIATSSYKKLTVLEALRSGITSHNFKKNHFPLETSRLPLSLVLAGKNIFGSGKKSVFITLIVAGLTFSSCLGFTLYQNWALDQSALLKLVGFEAADLQVFTPGNEEFVEAMLDNDNVRTVNEWSTLSSMEVTYLGNSTTLGIDVYSDIDRLEYDYILEGHLPQNENEIVLSTAEAEKIGVTLGDIVDVKSLADDSTVPYTVSGIDQKINNMGKKAVMNEEGALRLNPDYKFNYVLVYLNDPSMVKELKRQWEEDYPDCQFTLVDDLIGSTVNTLTSAMESICVIFIVATCFVVILTQLLLTRAQVIRERTELGVSKALGYTSGELIRRTLMTNIPTIVFGIILGIVMHIGIANRTVLLGLSAFGIRRNEFSTDPLWFVITAAIILLCAVLTAFFSGRSITRLDPVKILKEE